MYDIQRGKNPPVLVGYLNRRTGEIFTDSMKESRPLLGQKVNKSHSRRVDAANRMGFNRITEYEGRNNRSEQRSWSRKFLKDIRLLARIEKLKEAYQQSRTHRAEAIPGASESMERAALALAKAAEKLDNSRSKD